MRFTEGEVLGSVLQSEENMASGREDLWRGCASGVYEDLSSGYVRDRVKEGKMVSSAFTVWQGEGTERRGWFVVDFKSHRKHWPQRSVKMENITGFALNLQQDDHLMVGHPKWVPALLSPPSMLALPLGWERSVWW